MKIWALFCFLFYIHVSGKKKCYTLLSIASGMTSVHKTCNFARLQDRTRLVRKRGRHWLECKPVRSLEALDPLVVGLLR